MMRFMHDQIRYEPDRMLFEGFDSDFSLKRTLQEAFDHLRGILERFFYLGARG